MFESFPNIPCLNGWYESALTSYVWLFRNSTIKRNRETDRCDDIDNHQNGFDENSESKGWKLELRALQGECTDPRGDKAIDRSLVFDVPNFVKMEEERKNRVVLWLYGFTSTLKEKVTKRKGCHSGNVTREKLSSLVV